MALRKLKKRDVRKGNLSILVIRISKSGVIGMSEPCAHCLYLLKRMGISRIYYSNESGDIVNTRPNQLTPYYSRGHLYYNEFSSIH